MKTLIIILIFSVHAYTQTEVSSSAHSSYEIMDQKIKLESQTKSFIENYIRDLNDPDWANKIGPYLRNIEFIEKYRIFREAFADFNFKIKHLTVDGTEGILWATTTAKHVQEFNDFNFKEIPATNKMIEWDEVWYFTVEDGKKFGEKFESMQNHLQRMKSFGIKCLPE